MATATLNRTIAARDWLGLPIGTIIKNGDADNNAVDGWLVVGTDGDKLLTYAVHNGEVGEFRYAHSAISWDAMGHPFPGGEPASEVTSVTLELSVNEASAVMYRCSNYGGRISPLHQAILDALCSVSFNRSSCTLV